MIFIWIDMEIDKASDCPFIADVQIEANKSRIIIIYISNLSYHIWDGYENDIN